MPSHNAYENYLFCLYRLYPKGSSEIYYYIHYIKHAEKIARESGVFHDADAFEQFLLEIYGTGGIEIDE